MKMEAKSIKELKELVDFALDLTQLGLDVAKDKKVDMADLGLLLSNMPKLIAGGIAGFENVDQLPHELKDLSVEEAAELVAHVMAKLSIEDAKAKLVLEKSLKTLAGVYELVKAIVD